MYLRMVHRGARDEDSGRERGVFAAAYALQREKELSDADRLELDEILEWFEKNLPGKSTFGSRLTVQTIFWFKASHHEIVQRAWGLVNLLRRHDLAVEMVKTDRPGRVIYEDDMQIAAVPWRMTPQ